MTTQQVHWPRGGSVSDRIVACPGCVNEAAKWPKSPSNKYSIDGTHSHTLLETCLNRNMHPQAFVGSTLSDHEGAFKVDLDRAKRVKVAWDYVATRRHELGPDTKLYVEKFVDSGARFGIPGWGGSADIILESPTVIETIDFKDGGRPVSPESYQPITYTIGAIPEGRVPYEKYYVTIVQPKVSNEPNRLELYPIEFNTKVDVLKSAMVKSMDPNAERVAGEHCKYCPGAAPGRCPEYSDLVNGGMRTMTDLTTPAGQGPANLPFQLPEIGKDTTNEQLAQMLDAESLVKSLFKEAREEALKRAQGGVRIPGQKMVRASSNRRWRDEAFDTLEGMRVKADVYTEKKLRSPKQVLESDAYKNLSDAQKKRISELVYKPDGQLKLVPESDPGKAISFEAVDMFEKLPADSENPTQEKPAPISFF